MMVFGQLHFTYGARTSQNKYILRNKETLTHIQCSSQQSTKYLYQRFQRFLKLTQAMKIQD